MIWKNYSHLRGSHAFLSPSKYYWLRYDTEKLIASYKKHSKAALGTELHEIAAKLISLSIRQADIPVAFNMFVNDAISFRMSPEVVLYYSPNCYGTADAISWENKTLRIHDLKTGVSHVSMDQLIVYAALFCLDYDVKPKDIDGVHLRVYQGDESIIWEPPIRDVFDVTKIIVEKDRIIKEIEEDGIL